MNTVWLPGTLCDERVFGDLPDILGEPAHHVTMSDFSNVGDAAAATSDTVSQRFVAIGFSLGGFVALELLRRAPERVAGVVLISGNAHPDTPANADARREEIRFARENGMPALIGRSWPRLVGLSSRADAGLLQVLIDMAESVGLEGLSHQAEMNISRPDLRATAADAAVPLLLVAGGEDRLCPLERYAAAASGATASLEVVPDAGHFLSLEAPHALATIVMPFMRRLAQ